MQEGKQQQMILNHLVLEDVRQQLENSQNLDKRPRLLDIKSLEKQELKNLNYLCKSLRKETALEILNLEYITYGNSRVKNTELKKSYERFLEKEFFVINKSGNLKFFGDDFDKIYTKYYARERGIKFEFNNLPLFINFYDAVCNVLGIKESFYSVTKHNNLSSNSAIMFFANNGNLDADSPAILKAYKALFSFENSNPSHLQIAIKIEETHVYLNFFTNKKTEVKKFHDYVKAFNKRLATVATKIEFIESENTQLSVPKRKELDQQIFHINVSEVTESLIIFHENSFHNSHIKGNKELALKHCMSIYDLDINNGKQYCSEDFYSVQNVGYVFLINDELDKAEECFNSISEKANNLNKALCFYNKGILNLKRKNKDSCIDNMKKAIECVQKYDNKKHGNTVVCLIVPENYTTISSLTFVEREEELDLILIANNIISNLSKL